MRSVYNGTARDGSGNIISGATISVYLAGTATAANIYTTLTGATSTTSVTSASNGTFSFYIDNLEYGTSQTFKITISKTGYSSNTNDNIRIEDYVLGTYSITADATVTKSLRIPEGVILQVATGVTLSISGPVEAGAYQIFSGTGTVTVSSYPQERAWWGESQRLDLKSNLVLGSDANGDIYYRASGVTTRLPKGTAGQILKMNTGVTAPEWGAETVPENKFVQMQYSRSTTPVTTTVIIPLDNTIPQNTEGVELLTVSITPESASNILLIDASLGCIDTLSIGGIMCTLFQDAVASAIATSVIVLPSTGYLHEMSIHHIMLAGTTSTITFKLRFGPGGATTASALRGYYGYYFGGTMSMILKVTEVEP